MTGVQIGVSGLGSIGCRHARLLAAMPGVEVHGFDSHGVSDAAVAELGGLASIAPSLDALLERAPNGLIVATPDAVHVEQAELAVRAGVPVLVEKPLSNDLTSAQEITALASTLGVPAMVGYVLRHHGTMRRLQQLVAGGDIGAPASVHATLSAYETLVVARNRFDDAATYRLVFDYSHEWDYLQWLFGPIARCAATSRVRPGCLAVADTERRRCAARLRERPDGERPSGLRRPRRATLPRDRRGRRRRDGRRDRFDRARAARGRRTGRDRP